ncbi:MAG: cell division protein ZapD [Coxiellaceae bacterium]|nr:cell division protein ZapD [Coxiellaceae bacterium]
MTEVNSTIRFQTQCTTDCIVYEQPLNETFRLCLRLEYLFNQFDAALAHVQYSEDQMAMQSLMKLLSAIDRPDLKSKITQALSQQATTLGQLEQFPQVNKAQLYDILGQLDSLLNQLHHTQCKIGDSLRHHPFLNQIYSHINNPAGLCPFSVPAYALWRSKPADIRVTHLKQWVNEFRVIKQAVELILQLTRESTPSKKVMVSDGFHNQALDANMPCQLVRINLPTRLDIYPEISVGKHHLSVRFMQMDYIAGTPSQQYKAAFELSLTCCKL